MIKQKYRVIGLMSGTSLDGVDIVCCYFQLSGKKWEYRIEKAMTVSYTSSWLQKLSNSYNLPSAELLRLHTDYGSFLGNLCRKFIQLYAIKQVDFISSHGHTVFHQPVKKFTFQLGDGNTIHAISGLPVVYDFRSLDVALGGEGAPLVPIGDQILFSDYDVCLNLGGIANLSMQEGGKRIAFDVCFANLGLNYLSQKIGKEFDKRGVLASSGNLNNAMFEELKNVYAKLRKKRPSLGREIFEHHILSILEKKSIPLEDRLHTFTESIAYEVALAINSKRKKITMLCTGGGTFNSYLVYRMIDVLGDRVELIMPEADLIKFKEAIVFAFLGVLKVRNEINCLKSVTKASRDSSSGILAGF